MRFRDLARDVNRFEQKLENALLYVDFLQHELPIILLKDGSVLILFHLAGLDYEGLSEDEKEQFSHYARTALEQLREAHMLRAQQTIDMVGPAVRFDALGAGRTTFPSAAGSRKPDSPAAVQWSPTLNLRRWRSPSRAPL